MRSSTSSSELRFIAAFAATFLVLAASWEVVLRRRSGATLDFAIERPAVTATSTHDERWVIFGNCLVMTGISPRRLNEQLGDDHPRTMVNIATHEQSPIAYFEYLRKNNQYPAVVIANVSSWINGTNFDQEAELVATADPLGVGRPAPASERAASHEQAFRKDGDLGAGELQQRTERELTHIASAHVRTIGHRYHLFDYAMFVGTLVTRGDLDDALYQLNMQSWFTVIGNDTDGQGFVGLRVRYREDWPSGLERMAERSLQRLRLSRMLTDRYWSLLEADVGEFQRHGTHVILVRMPEHPKIREFNDHTYDVAGHLRGFEDRLGTPVVDLSALGPADGVRLFDGVHPDAPAAEVITRELATWLRARRDRLGARAQRPTGND